MTKIIDSKDVQKLYGEKNVGVIKRTNENIESLLKRFKNKVKNTGVLEDVKNKRYYTKRSIEKRMKRLESIREQRKKTKEDNKYN
jgi:small subunit ribosomal protein S21